MKNKKPKQQYKVIQATRTRSAIMKYQVVDTDDKRREVCLVAREKDAHRIAALLNSCWDLETEELEKVDNIFKSRRQTMPIMSQNEIEVYQRKLDKLQIDELKQERDTHKKTVKNSKDEALSLGIPLHDVMRAQEKLAIIDDFIEGV